MAQVPSTRVVPQRVQRKWVTSFPDFTSKRRSLLICQAWWPYWQRPRRRGGRGLKSRMSAMTVP